MSWAGERMRKVISRLAGLLAAVLVMGVVVAIAPLQSVTLTNESTGVFRDVVVRSECDTTRVTELRPGDSVRHWIGWCGRDSTSHVELTLKGTVYRGSVGYFGKVSSTTVELRLTDEVATVRSALLLPSPTRVASFSMARWGAIGEPRFPELPLL